MLSQFPGGSKFWNTHMGRDLSAFGRGLKYNERLATGLDALSGINSAAEIGVATGVLQNVSKVSYSTVKTGLRVTKGLGAAGVVLSAGIAVHELATGTHNTHTWADLGVTIVGAVAVGVAGTAALPVVAVAGLIYGVWSAAGGSDWIDDNWGYK
jgi:hypothetical protein